MVVSHYCLEINLSFIASAEHCLFKEVRFGFVIVIFNACLFNNRGDVVLLSAQQEICYLYSCSKWF